LLICTFSTARKPHLRTSFHHQPEAQHPNSSVSTSWQANYPISWGEPDTPGWRECRDPPDVGPKWAQAHRASSRQ
jgi:hypothetical protein